MSEQIVSVDIDQLHLDLDNPRLPTSVKKTPKAVLTWIARSTAIEDLMSAIATNGFFPGEPVVAYQHPTKAKQYIVIEGNRRLTACKLLADPQACEKPSAQMVAISNEAQHRPQRIPVVIAPSREGVLPYLGFRHITGIKEWDPLAKARYLKQLFDLTDKKSPIGDRYSQVARSIGSRRDHVKRSLDALAVYQVIEDDGFCNIEGLSEETIKFAVLSTALADERIGEFVGTAKRGAVSEEGVERLPTNPIVNAKNLKKPEIRELTKWLFEKKDGKTVVGESRNLRELALVVDHEAALKALRSHSSLARAYRLTIGIQQDFLQYLYAALSSLETAAGMVANAEYDKEAFRLAQELQNLVRQIGRTLKEKKVGEDDEF